LKQGGRANYTEKLPLNLEFHARVSTTFALRQGCRNKKEEAPKEQEQRRVPVATKTISPQIIPIALIVALTLGMKRPSLLNHFNIQ
jgi:hypothetical protein